MRIEDKHIKSIDDLDNKDPSNRYIKKALDGLCELLDITDDTDSYRDGVFLVTEKKNDDTSDEYTRYVNLSHASRDNIQVFVNILLESLKKQEVLDLFSNYIVDNKSEIQEMVDDGDIELTGQLEGLFDE